MRAMTAMLAAAGMLLPAGAWAQTGWMNVPGGKRHTASQLVCPSAAGSFELREPFGDEARFTCAYTFRCRAAEGCTNAVAFVSVTWDDKRDFDKEFRGMVTAQKYTLVPGGGPDWAGKPRLWGEAGAAPNYSNAGWWVLTTAKKKVLNIGMMFNTPAQPSAEALVKAVAAANR